MTAPAATRAETPHAGTTYRPELDSIRALAVVFVIISHFDERVLPGGFLGVDMFFVLSGFVVTASLHGRGVRGRDTFVLDFYARRIRRILPALVSCVVITAVVTSVFIEYPASSLQAGLYSLFAASNVFFYSSSTDYFGESAGDNPFTHTWSLGVEEQFYLLFPAILAVIGFTRPKRLIATFAALSAGSFALWLSGSDSNPQFSFYMMPARFWEFGLGCTAFLLSTRTWLQRSGRFALPVSVAALGAMFAAVLLPGGLVVASNIAICLAVAAFSLSTRDDHAVTRALSTRWLVRIGTLSYSLYLWHWPVIVLSRRTVGISARTLPFQVLLILLLAWASYSFIERPARYGAFIRRTKVVVLAGGVSVLAAAGFLVVLNQTPNPLFSADQPRFDISRASFPLDPSFEQCTIDSELGTGAQPLDCRYETASGTGQTLWMVGDSTTWALKGVASEVSRATGLEIVMMADDSAFPTTTLERVGGNWASRWPAVRDYNHRRFDYLVRQANAGDIALITANITFEFCHEPELYCTHVEGQDDRWRGPDGNALTIEEALHAYMAELGELNRALSDKDVHLVVSAPLPTWERHHRIYCERQWYRPRWEVDRCSSPDHSEQLQSRARLASVLQDAGQRYGFLVYDPFPFLCNAESCDFSDPATNVNYWTDETHLSTAGGVRLAPDFLSFLESRGLAAQEPVEL